MQLREIHIESFGTLRDRHAIGLSSGINVIHGPNEFGKTTLLNFVRRILFGFPDRRFKGNPYRVSGGAAHCGRLVCKLANGKTVIISRREGIDGGPLKILMDNTELFDQKELNRILDGIGGGFYQNVYAIDLDVLDKKESLEEDEVKSHIYGAGLGLGNISLKDIRDEFTNRAEEFFKPAGRNQRIPELYREILALEQDIRQIKTDLSKYDALVNDRDKLMDTVVLLNSQIRTLEREQRKLENQRNLFPEFVTLVRAEKRLSELEVLPLFTEGAPSELERWKSQITALDGQIEEETRELRKLQSERDNLLVNQIIIEKEADITSLQRNSEKYISAFNDVGGIEQERDRLRKRTRERIQKLGQGWTEESVKTFNLILLQEDKIHLTRDELSDANRIIDSAKNKLELYRDRKRQESSKTFAAPALLKYAIYSMAVLALIGAVLGFNANQTWLAALSTTVFVIGLGFILFMLFSKTSSLPDSLEHLYEEELFKAEKDFSELKNEWSKFLESINLDRDLSPDAADQALAEIKGIKNDLELLDREEKRIQEMHIAIKSVEKLHNNVATSFPKSKVSNDVATNIAIFNQILNEAKETETKKKGIEVQIRRFNTRIGGTKEKKRQAEAELQRYVSSVGAKGEDDFRIKCGIFNETQEQKGIIKRSKEIIQKTIGMDERYDNFIQSVSSTTPDEIGSKLKEIESQMQELERKRADADQEIGEKRNEINRLSSNDDLLEKQSELEFKKQRLRDYATDWVIPEIALFVRDKAIMQNETIRQPDVIKAAKDIFTNITNHAYSMIIKSAETNEIKIQDAMGGGKSIPEMSRGTKEQLYFAMRLGLIKDYEVKKEPMPIVMDDILVNFDDDRGPFAIKELATFARDRQVIVLTCHKNAIELYKSLGAKEVTLD
jgi:uncharacterized protein YhaN